MDRDKIEFYRYKNFKWVGPWYYNYPDGEDLPGKLSFCGQLGFFLSAPLGIANAYFVGPPPTSQMGRVVSVLSTVVPGIGMGLAFAATTYYSAKIRQKDDFVNHIYGGMAAGTIFGASTRIQNGVFAAFVLGIMAGALKLGHMESCDRSGKTFSPFTVRKLDFINYPKKGDNWVKAPAPQI